MHPISPAVTMSPGNDMLRRHRDLLCTVHNTTHTQECCVFSPNSDPHSSLWLAGGSELDENSLVYVVNIIARVLHFYNQNCVNFLWKPNEYGAVEKSLLSRIKITVFHCQ